MASGGKRDNAGRKGIGRKHLIQLKLTGTEKFAYAKSELGLRFFYFALRQKLGLCLHEITTLDEDDCEVCAECGQQSPENFKKYFVGNQNLLKDEKNSAV
jgi:hypothetical protein